MITYDHDWIILIDDTNLVKQLAVHNITNIVY